MKAYSSIPGAPAPIGPYSVVTVVGNTVYCAGQIALDPETMKIVDGGVEAQTAQVIKNLSAVLSHVGSSWDKVAMATVFLADIASGKVVNELYSRTVSKDAPPARQTVAVKDLPLGALVEISLIAYV